MFRYIYTSTLLWDHSPRTLHPYHFYALVFVTAIRFQLHHLARLALEAVELGNDVSRIDELLQEGIPELYTTMEEGLSLENREEMSKLREMLISKCARPWGKSMTRYTSFRDLVDGCPEFALECIEFLASDGGDVDGRNGDAGDGNVPTLTATGN